MVRKILSFLVSYLLLLSTLGWAQAEGFTVAGEISFTKTGDLYVRLMTKQEFESDKRSPFGLILKVGPEDIEKGRVSFIFNNVPQGTYGIKCFQDVNGNGKLDIGIFGPREPWRNYRPKRPIFRAPKFEEIAFRLEKDAIDIQSEVSFRVTVHGFWVQRFWVQRFWVHLKSELLIR